MAIAFRASAGGKGEAPGTDVNLTYPATIAANDVILVFLYYAGTGVTGLTPSGFTLVDGPFDKSTVLRSYLFAKVAAGTEAGTTLTVSVSASTSAKRYVNLLSYSGTDTTTPLQTDQGFVEVTAGTTHTAPNVSVSGTGAWVVEAYADRGSPGSTGWTTPAGFTKRDEQVGSGGAAITCATADKGPVSAGVNGGDTWTGTLSTASAIGWTVALNPLVAGAPPSPWIYTYDVRIGG